MCDSFETSSYSDDLKNQFIERNAATQDDNLNKTFNTRDEKTSSWTQLKWLVWRQILSQSRNSQETKVHIIQIVIIAILFGLTYGNSKLDIYGVHSINGGIYFVLANLSYIYVGAAISNYISDKPVFQREYSSKLYRLENYYFSKIISEVS